MAPSANANRLENAADHGEPSASGSRPSSSRAMVSRATLRSFMIAAATRSASAGSRPFAR